MCKYTAYTRSCGHTIAQLFLSEPCPTYLSCPEAGAPAFHPGQQRRSFIFDEKRTPFVTPCPSLQQFIQNQTIREDALPFRCPICYPTRPAHNSLYRAYAPPDVADVTWHVPECRTRRDFCGDVNWNSQPSARRAPTAQTERVSPANPTPKPAYKPRPAKRNRTPAAPVAPTLALPPQTPVTIWQTPVNVTIPPTPAAPAPSVQSPSSTWWTPVELSLPAAIDTPPGSVTVSRSSSKDSLNVNALTVEGSPGPPNPDSSQSPPSPTSWQMQLNGAGDEDLMAEFDMFGWEAKSPEPRGK